MSATLDVRVTTTPPAAGSTTWSLKIEVTAATDISPAIFAMQAQSKQGTENDYISRFSHVCTLAQLEEYPEDTLGDDWFYRVDSIELLFDSPTWCEQARTLILSDIQTLLTAARAAGAASVATYTL